MHLNHPDAPSLCKMYNCNYSSREKIAVMKLVARVCTKDFFNECIHSST